MLHRDISVGNILIVDELNHTRKFRGFIHDFDYSSSTTDADYMPMPALFDEEDIDYGELLDEPDKEEESDEEESIAKLKERTVSVPNVSVSLCQAPV